MDEQKSALASIPLNQSLMQRVFLLLTAAQLRKHGEKIIVRILLALFPLLQPRSGIIDFVFLLHLFNPLLSQYLVHNGCYYTPDGVESR